MDGFVETPAGRVPRLRTSLSRRDLLGTIGARTGFARSNYLLVPGLYGVGTPDTQSPVLVTANYKLTVDSLRRELAGLNLWLLVVDTRGINVWCAAGKGTFSAEEVAYQVSHCRLSQVVSHRRLILPQLAANGVAARELQSRCGFKARFGPILARDIPEFLKTGEATEAMRAVTFTLAERAVLVPLEVCTLWRALLVALIAFFLLSGISPAVWDAGLGLIRGGALLATSLLAVAAGAVATPLLLPHIPVRQFWLKGALLGTVTAALFLPGFAAGTIDKLALGLWLVGLSSYLAMNFTGSTPFTSLSGVEKEMRRGLPFQLGTTGLAVLLWLIGPFT